MTAKELIERLRRFPPDTEVVFDVKSLSNLSVESVDAYFVVANSRIKKVTITLNHEP
jgi:hypothetical protein